jgi:hypothetical protein
MDTKVYDQAVALAEARQHLYITTADKNGRPHLASVGSFVPLSDQRVEVGNCFCPTLLRNLNQNPHVSLVVWDITNDTGYQLLGRAEAFSTAEEAFSTNDEIIASGLDGHVVRVRVDHVLAFSHASHSDEDLAQMTSGPVVATFPV